MVAVKDIRDLDENALKEELSAMGQPAYRAGQIYKWLWQKGVRSFNEMSDLPAELREQLQQKFTFQPIEIALQQKSVDGTIKCAFKLWDDNYIEGVLIPTETRMTACVSSQVGCSLDCKFCATGYLKRSRNLQAYEIFDQVWLLDQLARENYGKGLNNIVYMGMGEPLLNFQQVMRSVELITSEKGLGMSAQRITISTAGIAKMIIKMADDGARFNLALSLHAANNAKRSAIMPINDSNNLEMLADAMSYWYQKTGIRPTLEYAVIDDLNDHDEEVAELTRFARKFPCKINLIEYNPISLADFKASGKTKLEHFAEALSANKLIVNVRRSRGRDIDAACGQLVNKSLLS
ncbi:MAG: 23S rRNA (adenine(2503)-C(2))-methyltransferase RlmN [Bacteroidetes bacterium]|nr:23S rRNA (adenine(2503)-C(2))-methyltransferase RlmN [Bacteroidota bacterium]